MMASTWLEQLFARRSCVVCQKRLTPRALTAAGSEQTPPVPEAGPPGWKGFLIVRCYHCGQRQKWTLPMSPLELHLAVTAVRKSAEARQTDRATERNVNEDRFTGGAISRPIEQSEVDAFLKRLGRTSFRRTSKSFRAWLRRLGINPNMPP